MIIEKQNFKNFKKLQKHPKHPKQIQNFQKNPKKSQKYPKIKNIHTIPLEKIEFLLKLSEVVRLPEYLECYLRYLTRRFKTQLYNH